MRVRRNRAAPPLRAHAVNRLKLAYDYGTTENNGNILSQTITVPTVGTVAGHAATQSYQYDELNRLKEAKEMNGTSESWRQTFIYDRYGNRRFDTNGTTASLITENPTFNPSTNRINSGGYRYDGAGNLECVPGEVCPATGAGYYEYDAESRLVKHEGGASVAGGASYSYDGDGRRVKKIVGGLTLKTTVFVYNALGQMVAEYDDSTQPGEGGTSYLTADSLGTPRVITGTNVNDSTGGVKARHDYLPFGEELQAGVGGRTTSQGYSQPDGVRQKFTSKERDDETGLDYFVNRYYSSSHGRFTTVDPTLLSVHGANPQTWNRYTYVLNNPLVFVDPLGLWGYRIEDIKDRNDKVTGQRFVFVKTKKDDNAESLLKQLGYKSGTKEGDKLLKSIEKQLGQGETVQGSKLAGVVGRVFQTVDKGLTAQATLPRTANGGPAYSTLNDCSMTTFSSAFPVQLSQYGGAGFPPFDVDTGDSLLTSGMNVDSPRSGDIVRYGKDETIEGQLIRNHATHFMSVMFTGDDGITQAFSRTGVSGKFEIVPVDRFNGGNYGQVQGKKGDKTGFYRPLF